MCHGYNKQNDNHVLNYFFFLAYSVNSTVCVLIRGGFPDHHVTMELKL